MKRLGILPRQVGVCQPGIKLAGGTKQTKLYHVWNDMLKRCYNEKVIAKNPSYTGCSVDPRFLSFGDFSEWAALQVGVNSQGFQLDKDILQPGNKIYSPDVCVFVPSAINNMLINRRKYNGLPVGVYQYGKAFRATCSKGGLTHYLGQYPSINEAFQAYVEFKNNLVKVVADQYQDIIDYRVYDVLMSFDAAKRPAP